MVQTLQEALANLETEFLYLVVAVSLVLVGAALYLFASPAVYLVDFVVLHPGEEYTVSKEKFMVPHPSTHPKSAHGLPAPDQPWMGGALT
jgi:hypothetical protein